MKITIKKVDAEGFIRKKARAIHSGHIVLTLPRLHVAIHS